VLELRVSWLKGLRDLLVAPGRTLLLVLAVTTSLAAVGTVLGARAVLVREIALSYRSTTPAQATLVLHDPVDEALLERVRARPEVERADVREVVVSRLQVGREWKPLLLFVVADFETTQLNTFRPLSGSWPAPGSRSLLVERSALADLGAMPGDTVVVSVPSPTAAPLPLTIAGLVHDPGLAPATMERTTYGYIDQATFTALDPASALHELRVSFAQTEDAAGIVARSDALAAWLATSGKPVHEIRVPPPGMHPHQRQMETIMLLMLGFAGLGLLLSGVVVASSLTALLARQVREIGVLKTLGARTSQLGAVYAVLVGGIGLLSVLLASPLAVLGARAQASAVAGMLNFDLQSLSIPPGVFGVLVLAGMGVPLLLAAVPIRRAIGMPVREALAQHGAASGSVRSWVTRLPRSARDAMRRPRRLAMNLVLLASGGAMFMTALDVRASWERNLDQMDETRHYDAEIRFALDEDPSVIDEVRAVPGVLQVESWGLSDAAMARRDGIALTHTWPDKGHGSFVALAPPVDTELVDFPLLEGRRLREDDLDGVVVNHSVRGVEVGERVALLVDDEPAELTVVGIIEEIGAPAAVYLTPEAYRRLTGAEGVQMLRVVTGPDRTRILDELEGALAHREVGLMLPFVEHRTAVSEHIGVLVQTLLAMAIVLAVVGGVGLASATATSVLERTREIGIQKAVGALPRRIVGALVAEALTVAFASWFVAMAASVPLAAGMDILIGQLGFLAPLPLVLDPGAAGMWLGVVLAVAAGASVLPAWSAAHRPVHEALATV
jgi:putative ABC transport system permease protein